VGCEYFILILVDCLLIYHPQGPAIALAIVAAVECWFIYTTSWEKAVEEAQERNAQGNS
jgi:hypothetical protein